MGIKKLYLNNNIISNLIELGKVKFEKLELLDLSNNNISDINFLIKTNFQY